MLLSSALTCFIVNVLLARINYLIAVGSCILLLQVVLLVVLGKVLGISFDHCGRGSWHAPPLIALVVLCILVADRLTVPSLATLNSLLAVVRTSIAAGCQQ